MRAPPAFVEPVLNRLRMVRHLRGIIATGLVALIGAGFSAQATYSKHGADDIAVGPPAPQGYEADDHFTGSAYFFVTDQNAAPGAGTTGTIALPDIPVPQGADVEAASLDGTIHPAQPFSMAAASSLDRARAAQCLTTAIYYEAAREPDEGQRGVAQVILNRVRHPAFPHTVCGVVYQGSEKRGCQFSFACDGSMSRAPNREYWARAARVANDALSGQVLAPVGLATHYHTYAVTPSWNRSLVMTAAIGAHFFHRWQGWWGTPAAFSARYMGHEPAPGPHAPINPAPVIAAATLPSPAPAVTRADPHAARPAPVTPVSSIKPAYVETSTIRTPAVVSVKPGPSQANKPGWAGEQELPESTILDKWKDSGRPK